MENEIMMNNEVEATANTQELKGLKKMAAKAANVDWKQKAKKAVVVLASFGLGFGTAKAIDAKNAKKSAAAVAPELGTQEPVEVTAYTNVTND